MSKLSREILRTDGENRCHQDVIDLANEVEALEKVLRTLGKASDVTGDQQAVTGSDLSVASVAHEKPNEGGPSPESLLLQVPVRRNLNLSVLRPINVLRCNDDFNHTLESWSVAEWSNAMAGEAGEACNIAKKMIRFRDGARGNSLSDSLVDFRIMLAHEIADVVIYADLLAASQDINLSEAVIEKFNITSEKLGSQWKL